MAGHAGGRLGFVSARLAILYEHPYWFQSLFAELSRQGTRFEEWRAEKLLWKEGRPNGVELVFNRMSASARWRGHEGAQFATLGYLKHLEEIGVETVNGSRAYEYEISKARQLDLFRRCGVPYPRTVVVNHAGLLSEAGSGLRFPVVVKPNCGGAGQGICRFEDARGLAGAQPDFGADHTVLVQEYVEPASGQILRVEVLGGEVLYAMEVAATGFNLCPADSCGAGQRRFLDAPREVADMALALARHAGIDAGGFEFLFDGKSREWLCYDVNALSNFAPEAAGYLGFDPVARLAAYLRRRLDVPVR
jgi:glutathione synthase/RimK-type ligase-like ATP-grasp enzyme